MNDQQPRKRRRSRVLLATGITIALLGLVVQGAPQTSVIPRAGAQGPVTASSSMGTCCWWNGFANPPANMVDGDLGTSFWSNRNIQAGDWVKVDLGSTQSVTEIELLMTRPFSPEDFISQGVVEVSSDDANWTQIGSFSGQAEVHVTAPADTNARYVRARATASKFAWLAVREFVVGTGETPPPNGDPPPPEESVDDVYSASGPWAVTAESVTIPGDGGGSTLVYPSDLGADGYLHPIVTFANGLDATCPPETSLFHHLASWGYVVVCPITGQILDTHLVAAAEWVVAQNSDASSVFFEKLDTESVGAIGFSRGAGFSTIAVSENPDLFTTLVPISLVDRWLQGDDVAVDALRNPAMSNVPVFFVAGTNEVAFFFIRLVTEPEQKFFFDEKPGPAARGAGVGIGHTLNPDDPRTGYITAWLKYTLEDDEFARQAFVGAPPEINTNPAWDWQEQKNLP